MSPVPQATSRTLDEAPSPKAVTISNAWSTSFYLNAGSVSGDPWGMNDGSTSYGMAAVVTIDGKRGKFVFKRFRPPLDE